MDLDVVNMDADMLSGDEFKSNFQKKCQKLAKSEIFKNSVELNLFTLDPTFVRSVLKESVTKTRFSKFEREIAFSS